MAECVPKALDSGANDNYRTGKIGEVLFVFDSRIDSEKSIKTGGGGLAQKNPIADSNPTHVGGRENLMTWQVLP